MKRFKDIAGMAHAKRAAEVAIAGEHWVLFIGSLDSQARDLAQVVDFYGSKLNQPGAKGESVSPCPCGNYRSKIQKCMCSIEQVTDWQISTWPMGQPQITIEVPAVSPDSIMRWARNRFKDGEPESQIAARITQAISESDTVETEENIWHLLEAAVRQLRLQPRHVKDILAVANTIAKLGGRDTIEACHVAEAIQYRPPEWTKWG